MASKGDFEELKKDHAAQKTTPASSGPIYVSTHKIDRFKDHSEKSGDPTIEDWVADMRNHLAARKLSGQSAAAALRNI